MNLYSFFPEICNLTPSPLLKLVTKKYGKRAKSKRERGYRIDEITYAKSVATLNAYMCAQEGMWEGSKNLS